MRGRLAPLLRHCAELCKPLPVEVAANNSTRPCAILSPHFAEPHAWSPCLFWCVAWLETCMCSRSSIIGPSANTARLRTSSSHPS